MKPLSYRSCFISYASKDDHFARKLHSDLQESGVRCWFAPEDMKIGDRLRTTIDNVIHLHERVLLVLSDEAISSAWVEKEVETALEKQQEHNLSVLFPIRLDDAVMNSRIGWAGDIKRSRQIGDFRDWNNPDCYASSFARLLRDLRVGE